MAITGVSQTSASSDQAVSAALASSGTEKLANTETFLQLLVAQIRNQDPMNPSDGTQFLTQLAQFSELEQMIGVKNEVAGLRSDLKQPVPGTGGSTAGEGA